MRKLIYVADDYDQIADFMALLLVHRKSFDAVALKDGVEVLSLAEVRRPDACVLDINMPRMGGVETARLLRIKFPGPSLLLIGITGTLPLEPIINARVFDHVFSKPLDMEKLVRVLGP